MTTALRPLPTFEVAGHLVALTATSTVLPGGRVGHFQRSPEDCLRAAVATLKQVDYAALAALALPDQRYGKVAELRHWGALFGWAHDRGEAVTFHHEPTGAEWALGFAPTVSMRDGVHVVVLRRDEVFFDPASGWEVLDGPDLAVAPVTEIHYAVTIEPKGS